MGDVRDGSVAVLFGSVMAVVMGEVDGDWRHGVFQNCAVWIRLLMRDQQQKLGMVIKGLLINFFKKLILTTFHFFAIFEFKPISNVKRTGLTLLNKLLRRKI